MRVVGLDGYRAGWVAVWIDGDASGIEFLHDVSELLTFSFHLAMIDIPIGLPEIGDRRCDIQARSILGESWPRVFTGARRGLLRFDSTQYDAANRWGKSIGAGVSRQLFCLLPKISEVDTIINKRKQSNIRETHPELVFLRLNSGQRLPGKKTKEGKNIRCDLIKKAGFLDIQDWIDRRRMGTGAKPDDILDACACAIAARDAKHRIPDTKPQIDSRGLRMEIWY
jgi:predicted RNase H-like nuclease